MADQAPAPQPPIFNLNAYSPAEIKEAVEKVGVKKTKLPPAASFMLAIVAGGSVGLGAHFIIPSSPAMQSLASPPPVCLVDWRFRSDWRSFWWAAPSCSQATT